MPYGFDKCYKGGGKVRTKKKGKKKYQHVCYDESGEHKGYVKKKKSKKGKK